MRSSQGPDGPGKLLQLHELSKELLQVHRPSRELLQLHELSRELMGLHEPSGDSVRPRVPFGELLGLHELVPSAIHLGHGVVGLPLAAVRAPLAGWDVRPDLGEETTHREGARWGLLALDAHLCKTPAGRLVVEQHWAHSFGSPWKTSLSEQSYTVKYWACSEVTPSAHLQQF